MAARKKTQRKPASSERRRVSKAEWLSRALQLDERGWSIRKIARHLGLHHSTVDEALRREYDAVKPSPDQVEAAKQRALLRQHVRLVRADRLIRTYSAKAMKGDVEAAKVVIDADARIVDKALAAIARLEGTEAPTKRELSGPEGGPVPFGLASVSDEQLEHILASLDSGTDAGGAPRSGASGEGAKGGTGK